MEAQALEKEFRGWQGFQQGEIRQTGRPHRQRKENEHTQTRTLRGLHTHMQHNWNGLHLDWCRDLEACI